MMHETSLSSLQDDLKALIIEKVACNDRSRTSLRNTSEELGVSTYSVLDKIPGLSGLGSNAFKLPDVDVATISFIRRIHEEIIDESSLFFGIYKFFYEKNDNGLPILKQLVDSSIGEAVYAYGIALLCNGQYNSGRDQLQSILEEEDGSFFFPACRCAFKKIIGPERFENIPPLRFCGENTVGHWGSINPNTIKGWAEFDITCENCMVAVEHKKLTMPLVWNPDLEYLNYRLMKVVAIPIVLTFLVIYHLQLVFC